jgi:hypothetical protein
MAGTVSLQTTAGWVTYLNTKATPAKEKIQVNANAIEAYNGSDGKTIVLPYTFSPSAQLVLPAFESDGTTASIKTFRFLTRYGIPFKVTYSGNATA